ncbi:MAG: Glycine dehydrogenase [decarboxylating] (glycine cleavage system P protein), partial [uncultured Acetobacteraceae bacterium]
ERPEGTRRAGGPRRFHRTPRRADRGRDRGDAPGGGRRELGGFGRAHPARRHRRRGPFRPAGAGHRGGGLGRAARHERAQRLAGEVADRPRLPQHPRPARHPAQRAGEPRLVHGLHALPSGDRAGAAGSAGELPNGGGGPDGAARRQRLLAGRGHGGGRGGGAGQGRAPRQRERAAGGGGPAPADPGGGARPRRAGRHRGEGRAPGGDHRRGGSGEALRGAAPVPRHHRRGARPLARDRGGAQGRGDGGRVRGPALALPADAARRDGRGRGGGQHAALRRAARLRRPARGLHGG